MKLFTLPYASGFAVNAIASSTVHLKGLCAQGVLLSATQPFFKPPIQKLDGETTT